MSELDHLPERIGDTLEPDIDEPRVHALWKGLGQRTQERALQRRTRRARWAIGVSFTAVAIAIAWVLLRDPAPRDPFIHLANGAVPVSRTVEPDQPALFIAFEEGSQIRLAPGSRIVPLRNEAGLFETEILGGSARFTVTPGLDRRWRVRLGPTLVEVIGTEFLLEHSEARTRIAVSRGVVRVTDPALDGPRILRRGDELVLLRSEPPAPIAPRAESPSEAPEPAAVPSPNWRALARRGQHEAAYRALGDRGVESEARRADPEQLMLLADVARLSGHPRDAVAPLERLIAEYPRDARAGIGAIMLGRLEMDRLGRPDHARAAFERALELGVPAALREDVTARLARLPP